VFALGAALVLGLTGCSNGEQAQNDTSGPNKSYQGNLTVEGAEAHLTITNTEVGEGAQELTPIVAKVPYAPIPFAGSDGQKHLVYELEATNFTSGKATIGQLEVLDADAGDVVATLDAKEVASRLQSAGLREAADTFDPSTTALIFLHLTFAEADKVPARLVHRLSA
jgi:hypothetical protein